MAVRSLNERVEILEQKVGELQELPTRMAAVESQILQLRGEMRDGFSATVTRIQEGDKESRRYARTLHDEVLTQMRVLHEDVISRLALLQEGRGRRKR